MEEIVKDTLAEESVSAEESGQDDPAVNEEALFDMGEEEDMDEPV